MLRLISSTESTDGNLLIFVDDERNAVVVIQDTGTDVDRLVINRDKLLAVATLVQTDKESGQ